MTVCKVVPLVLLLSTASTLEKKIQTKSTGSLPNEGGQGLNSFENVWIHVYYVNPQVIIWRKAKVHVLWQLQFLCYLHIAGFYDALAKVFGSETVLKCNESRFLCNVSSVLQDQHSFPHGFFFLL